MYGPFDDCGFANKIKRHIMDESCALNLAITKRNRHKLAMHVMFCQSVNCCWIT